MSQHYSDLIKLFARCFSAAENTRLVAGEHEPYYQPAGELPYHQVVFAHGFFASALHEIAHWCIAGALRRQLFDYGYWYQAEGRNAEQQALFEQIECKPQALEWLFSLCSAAPFQVSVDNLSGIEVDRSAFTEAVRGQLVSYLDHGLPPRAEQFAKALAAFYQQPWPPTVPLAISKESALCAPFDLA